MFKKLETEKNEPDMQNEYLRKFGTDCLIKIEQISLRFNHYEGIANEPLQIFLPKIQSIIDSFEILSYEIYDSCQTCGYGDLGHTIVKMILQMHSVIKWILTNLTKRNKKNRGVSKRASSQQRSAKSSIFGGQGIDFRKKQIRLHNMKFLAKDIENQIKRQCQKEAQSQTSNDLIKEYRQAKQSVMNTNSSDARLLLIEALNFFEKKCQITDRFVELKENCLDDPQSFVENYLGLKSPQQINQNIDILNESKINKVKTILKRLVSQIESKRCVKMAEQAIQVNTFQMNHEKKDKETNSFRKQLQKEQALRQKIYDEYKILKEKYHSLQNHLNQFKWQKRRESNRIPLKSEAIASTIDIDFSKLNKQQANQKTEDHGSEMENFKGRKLLDIIEPKKKNMKKRWNFLIDQTKENKKNSRNTKIRSKFFIDDRNEVMESLDSDRNHLQIQTLQLSPNQISVAILPTPQKLSKNKQEIVQAYSKTLNITKPIGISWDNSCVNSPERANIKMKSYLSANSPRALSSCKIMEYSENWDGLITKSIKSIALKESSDVNHIPSKKEFSNRIKIGKKCSIIKVDEQPLNKIESEICPQYSKRRYVKSRQMEFRQNRISSSGSSKTTQVHLIDILTQNYQQILIHKPKISKIYPSIETLEGIFIDKQNAQNSELIYLSEIHLSRKKFKGPASERKRDMLNLVRSDIKNNKDKPQHRLFVSPTAQYISHQIFKSLVALKKIEKPHKLYYVIWTLFLKYPFSMVMKKEQSHWKQHLSSIKKNLDSTGYSAELKISIFEIETIIERVLKFHEKCEKKYHSEGDGEKFFCGHIGKLGAFYGMNIKQINNF